MCKGAIPIPTPKNKEQVEDSTQALGWRLKKQDEESLDALGLVIAPDWYIQALPKLVIYSTHLHFKMNMLMNLRWWEQG